MLCVLIRIASLRQFQWVHSTYNHCVENQKNFPKLSLFASWTGAMINPQWLELPRFRTNFHGPKDVWANEVRLYVVDQETICVNIFTYCGLWNKEANSDLILASE